MVISSQGDIYLYISLSLAYSSLPNFDSVNINFHLQNLKIRRILKPHFPIPNISLFNPHILKYFLRTSNADIPNCYLKWSIRHYKRASIPVFKGNTPTYVVTRLCHLNYFATVRWICTDPNFKGAIIMRNAVNSSARQFAVLFIRRRIV